MAGAVWAGGEGVREDQHSSRQLGEQQDLFPHGAEGRNDAGGRSPLPAVLRVDCHVVIGGGTSMSAFSHIASDDV